MYQEDRQLKERVTVGVYEFDKRVQLGRGQFGVVYRGRALANKNQKVAVKVIKSGSASSTSNLKREIDVLKDISSLNHENFVQLFYSEERGHKVLLVMEFCETDMAAYLERHKKLPETTVAIFVRQIVNGLKVLKLNRIIHRDLKPNNLLLSYTVPDPIPEDITVKIADFGLARFLPDDYIQQLTHCGTIVYMAPEALVSTNYGSKCDIWSVGVIMHQMVFGSLPFEQLYSQAIQHYVCPSNASPPLQHLLNNMLKQNPAERIDLQKLAYHEFLQTPRQKQIMDLKMRYLPGQMPRSEKRKLYMNEIGVPDIPTWHELTSKHSVLDALYEVDHDLNQRVSIWTGDITKLEVDAIVNPANPNLDKGVTAGANKAIHDAAGPFLEQETTSLVGGCDFGSAEVSAGYNLPAYYVIHTVGPNNCEAEVLSGCYENCLQKVLEYNIRTVAFPSIATGYFGFPMEEATKIALNSVREWLNTGTNRTQVDRVIFACFTPDSLEAYQKQMAVYFPKV